MVGDAGDPLLQPATLPGVGASLLNMPLQEQLKLMQQGGALPVVPPLVLNGVPMPAAPAAPARSPQGAGGRKKAARGSVARPSDREATKGTTSSSNRSLSSKFRGVCWNRKNKRWQAAINSGGARPRACSRVPPGPRTRGCGERAGGPARAQHTRTRARTHTHTHTDNPTHPRHPSPPPPNKTTPRQVPIPGVVYRRGRGRDGL